MKILSISLLFTVNVTCFESSNEDLDAQLTYNDKCDVKCQNESNQIMKEKLTRFLAPRFSVEAEDPIKSLLLLNELSWENTDTESNISRTTLYTIDCDFGSEKIKRDAKLTNVSTATTDNRCNITTAVSAFIATNTSNTITTTTSTNTTIDIVTTAKERTSYDNTSILVELDEWTSIPMDELEEFWLYLCPVIEEVELEKTAQLSYIKCDTKNSACALEIFMKDQEFHFSANCSLDESTVAPCLNPDTESHCFHSFTVDGVYGGSRCCALNSYSLFQTAGYRMWWDRTDNYQLHFLKESASFLPTATSGEPEIRKRQSTLRIIIVTIGGVLVSIVLTVVIIVYFYY